MITPSYLQPGDSVGIIATARKVSQMELMPAIDKFREWGLQVVLGSNIFAKHDQFAGNDKQRAFDLQYMLDDENIKAIIVPICIAIDPNTVNSQILTTIIGLHPAGGIFESNTGNPGIFAVNHFNDLGAYNFRRSLLLMVVFFGIKLTDIKQAVNIQSQPSPLAIDRTFTCNGDTGLVIRQNKGFPAIETRIMVGIGASKENGIPLEEQLNSRFQDNTSR